MIARTSPKKGELAVADKKWIQGAIKHPGALTAEAKASGRSKLQQAIHDTQSPDPSTRSRGYLGKRFLQHKIGPKPGSK